jgi:hypothetical protein
VRVDVEAFSDDVVVDVAQQDVRRAERAARQHDDRRASTRNAAGRGFVARSTNAPRRPSTRPSAISSFVTRASL